MPTGRGGVRNTGNCEGKGRYCTGIGRSGGSPGIPEEHLMYSEWKRYWESFLANWKVWVSLLLAFAIIRVVRWSDGSR